MPSPIPGPRWRGLSLSAAAERLGVPRSAIRHAVAHGRIETRRNRGLTLISLAELNRFAASPAAWAIAHPREIVDPELRAHALAAWEAAGSPTLYAPGDLCWRYHIAPSTLRRWRSLGWPAPGAWQWCGGARGGIAWLVWPGPLPAPYTPRRPTFPSRRARGEATRAAVIRLVAEAGGSPGQWSRAGLWSRVGAAAGVAPGYARRIWYAYTQETRHAAAD